MSAAKKGVDWGINFGRIVCKRVKNNLYGGKNVQFGNRISEDGGNKYVHDERVVLSPVTLTLRRVCS